MKTSTTISATIAIVSALALVIAPALVASASAVKEEITTCPSGNPCQGASGEKNPNREEKCVAGSKQQENANCP
jgi:hypothetical protein